MSIIRHWRHGRSIGLIACVVGLLASGCGSDGSAAPEGTAGEQATADAADASFDWRAFEGSSIRVLMVEHPVLSALEPHVADFEELTGIDVQLESLPPDGQRQRVQVELTGGGGDLDVFMAAAQQDGARFSENGWFADLQQYVDDPSLTNPDYDFDDFHDSVIEAHRFGDTLVGMPIESSANILFYRKSALEAAGVEVPTTLEELEEVAQAIDDPNGMRAFTARGRGAAAVSAFAPFLYAMGSEWTNEDGTAAFGSQAGIEAFEYYGRILRDYGPRGAVSNSWQEIVPLFVQGDLAMFSDTASYFTEWSDSEMADDVGYAAFPSGPGGPASGSWTWVLSIPAMSEQQQAAWYFIQWATSPDMVRVFQEEEGVTGARESIGFGEAFPDEWIPAFQESLANSKPLLPEVVPVPEVRDVIGDLIVNSIEGADVAPEVERTVQRFNDIVANR